MFGTVLTIDVSRGCLRQFFREWLCCGLNKTIIYFMVQAPTFVASAVASFGFK